GRPARHGRGNGRNRRVAGGRRIRLHHRDRHRRRWRADIVSETRDSLRADDAALDAFCHAVLAACGADAPTARAATDAMMHGSRLGVDSHGVRLLDHYVEALEGGRLNKAPAIRFSAQFGAVGTLDADAAHGALAAYEGMRHAIGFAEKFGIGAVTIRNSSHFGPAGAFAMQAAQAGFIGLA